MAKNGQKSAEIGQKTAKIQTKNFWSKNLFYLVFHGDFSDTKLAKI